MSFGTVEGKDSYVSKYGDSMLGPLNINNQRLTGLRTATAASDAVRFDQFQSATNARGRCVLLQSDSKTYEFNNEIVPINITAFSSFYISAYSEIQYLIHLDCQIDKTGSSFNLGALYYTVFNLTDKKIGVSLLTNNGIIDQYLAATGRKIGNTSQWYCALAFEHGMYMSQNLTTAPLVIACDNFGYNNISGSITITMQLYGAIY